MVFKKMLSAFGVGGPSVDTVLTNPNTRPGLTLDGQVNLVGGDAEAAIEQVVIGLVTRVEVEGRRHRVRRHDGVPPHGGQRPAPARPEAAALDPVPAAGAVGDPDHRRVRPAPARHDDGPAHRAGDRPRGRQERPGPGGGAPAAGARADPGGVPAARLPVQARRPGAWPHPGRAADAAVLPGDRVLRRTAVREHDPRGRADLRHQPARRGGHPGVRQARRVPQRRARRLRPLPGVARRRRPGRLGAGRRRLAARDHVPLRQPALAVRREPRHGTQPRARHGRHGGRCGARRRAAAWSPAR